MSLIITCCYSPGELACRPIEHTLELIAESRGRQATCRELGRLIGCDKNSAAALLRGDRDPTEEEIQRIRSGLASARYIGNVSGERRAPASGNSRGVTDSRRR